MWDPLKRKHVKVMQIQKPLSELYMRRTLPFVGFAMGRSLYRLSYQSYMKKRLQGFPRYNVTSCTDPPENALVNNS